ncbi:MAG: pilus assembly protein PilN [Gammaproteobacteria bacterium]|nr:MAG: pilus assembly protein PilN [Gammaproteobacteria bacterium]
MATINLLPWREERRQERQQQFITALVAGFIFAAIILFSVISYANGQLDKQRARNSFLTTEVAKLDRKIAEIKTLDAEREKLVARMDVIQRLQTSRPKIVKVFDALVRSVPEGIHLEMISRDGEMITLNGVAQSNARVSVFMREIEKNDQFEDPQLNIIQRTSTADDAIRNFTLKMKQSKLITEDGEL